MKPKLHPQHWKQAAKHYLKATGRLLVLVLFSIFPLIACAVMALHRLWLLLVFLMLRVLGERTLHRLGWLRQGHRLRPVRSRVARSVDDFLEDVKAILERI